MREIKEKQPANPIVQRIITNPSVPVLRCSLQQLGMKHEGVNEKTDKNGSPIREVLHHYTLTFSQDTIDSLTREGALN